jgi:hypothetical protein
LNLSLSSTSLNLSLSSTSSYGSHLHRVDFNFLWVLALVILIAGQQACK